MKMTKGKPISPGQLKALHATFRSKGFDEEDRHDFISRFTEGQGERSITCTSYYSLYFFNPNDFISYFLVPSTRFPLSCHSQFDIALF